MASDINLAMRRLKETKYDPDNPHAEVYHRAGEQIFELQELLGLTKKRNMGQEVRKKLLELKEGVELVRAHAQGKAIEIYLKEISK